MTVRLPGTIGGGVVRTPTGVPCIPGGLVASYWQPLIANEVETADPGAQVSSWTQDPITLEHTVDVVMGAAAVSGNPNVMAYFVIPLRDVFDVVIGLDEMAACNIYIVHNSGMVDLSKLVLYSGISAGPSLATDKTVWGRLEALFAGKPRGCRSGRLGTVQPAVPPGFGADRLRIEFMHETAGAVESRTRIVETLCSGDTGAALVTGSGLGGVSTDLDKAPHIFIAVGGSAGTPSAQTLKFNVHVEALRHPGGAFP